MKFMRWIMSDGVAPHQRRSSSPSGTKELGYERRGSIGSSLLSEEPSIPSSAPSASPAVEELRSGSDVNTTIWE